MKSDISRQTFNPEKHYIKVLMQQGRVQIDADWNEESDINIHRIETEALDLIGGCGGPIDAAAFGIIAGTGVVFDAATLDPHEQERLTGLGVLPLKSGDFLLTAGRYYVDGILCENELIVSFDTQPDFPTLRNDSHIPLVKGRANPVYLAYLDVWERSITAIDDSQIREVALGGPDTCTRLKTVWQVKLSPISEDSNCVKAFKEFLSANPPSSGSLSAKTESEAISPDPCIVPPGAGFRGLENQLYRIEIHNGGAAFDVAGGAAGTAVTDIIGNNQVTTTGTWTVGQAVEIFSGDAPANLRTRTLAYITIVDQNTGTLTLNTKITNLTMQEHPRIRAVNATFKWSRDNGSVVTVIERIEGREITVGHTGLDTVLGFAPDQWVEIIDDALDLNGRPGQLAQIAEVDSARRLITLKTDPTLLDTSPDGVNPAFHPKLRRWDGIGAVNVDASSAITGYLNIEDGVQVRFGAGNYNTGDYWMIPARTATTDAQSGKIEWPQENNNPLALSPFGIRHHYCPLGLLSFSKADGFILIDDCRQLFPPVTELTSLFYVSGDGQEAMPDPKLPDVLLPLKQSLVVGVANGSRPVKGALVLFEVLVEVPDTGGKVMRKGEEPEGNGKAIGVVTDENGLAACDWHIDSITQSQQVSARLLDAEGTPVHLPVIFTANLSVASEVAYDTGNCLALLGQNTVKKMLDTLSLVPSLYYLSGDGQEVMPGQKLQPLRVLVANRCGPVSGRTVRFIPVPNTGALTDITTDSNGVAEFRWSLNTSTHRQEMEATLIANSANPATTPTKVRFSATLSTADEVSYVPPAECLDLAEAKTVQAAIDALCKRKSGGGGCAVTVGKGGEFESLEEAISNLLGVPQQFKNVDVCICLLPGDHELANGLDMNGTGNKVQIKIEGCGHGTRIIMQQKPVIAFGLVSFMLRDVEVFADQPEAFFRFERCDDITFEGCYLTRENQANPFITIAHARRIQVEGNFIQAFLPLPEKAVTPDKVFADVDPAVAELFNISNRSEFDSKSSQIASRLAQLTPKGKAAFMTRLRQSLEKLENLTSGEAKSYGGFQQAFDAQPVDEDLIRARLADIKVSALRGEPGIAFVIMDAEADTWIESNNIEGVVSLYGVPGKETLTEVEMRALSLGFEQGLVTFSNSLANLQVLNNVIYRMDVSAQTITLLKTPLNPSRASSIDGRYRRCFITDNAISGSNNNFVMEHLALTSNSFDKRIVSQDTLTDAGTVVANAAINVGNYAPDDVRLLVVARTKEKAANLGISIVEF